MKVFLILAAAALLIALPFLFRGESVASDWRRGDPELVVVTPHNEAIRQEFAEGFSKWHQERYGRPVRIDWRVIGGTTEIMRYLGSEYVASSRRFFQSQGIAWPADGAEVVLARQRPKKEEMWALWEAFRSGDAPEEISCRMDVFFGGGTYDHEKAEKQGLTVPAWGAAGPPVGLFKDTEGRILIPVERGGEKWCGSAFYCTVLSAFGICYNTDRLADLGIAKAPAAWEDLCDPRYVGCLGLADPTKSASVAKAYEMIIHTQCAKAVAGAGFTREQVRHYEASFAGAKGGAGEMPQGVPRSYQQAVEEGWAAGMNLLRRLGANARYFTDSSGRVPVDVSAGAAAAGIAIDFMGRFQAEMTAREGEKPVLAFVSPVGETSVTSDPVSLLRGAPHRELAVRFIEFTLGVDGQKLWCYRPGAPGGPRRFALRRLPVRRDFYPSADPEIQKRADVHRPYLADPLWLPVVDAYHLAQAFQYEPRWTSVHFGIQRDLVRAMCLDSGDELKQAWRAILQGGGPAANPEAMRLLEALPQKPLPLTWRSAITEYTHVPRLEYLREWTAFFREQYRLAEAQAKRESIKSKGPNDNGDVR
jgi:ABC-type Fe3+ transport system substrate-binding protein